MSKKVTLVAVLLTSLLCVGFARQAKTPQYEYKVEYFGNISEKKLNELGAQGWEFVGAANEDGLNEFIFKRAHQ